MSLQVLPNMEALVAGWLREHPDIEALQARVGPRTPSGMTKPWVRVTQLAADDDFTSNVEYLVNYMLQLDCYAGSTATAADVGQGEAWRLKSAVRAVLKSVQGTVLDGVVVTRVRFNGDARIPDTTLGDPARERYVLTVELMAHAVPA